MFKFANLCLLIPYKPNSSNVLGSLTPLGWTAELIVDGTLDDLLHTAGLVLDGLDEVAADPSTP